MSNQLTQHDLELLRIAVCCVTQFSCKFAQNIWGVSRTATTRRLRRLEFRGLIASRNVLASTPPPVTEPLCIWKPSEPMPHHGQVSYQARKRWKSLPVEVKRIYHATTLGRGLFGRGPISPPKSIQATHDLGLAETFLEFRRRWPRLTRRCWLNESEYAHYRGRCVKVEDAMLRRGDEVLLMVDYAGQYRPDRVYELLSHANLHSTSIAIF